MSGHSVAKEANKGIGPHEQSHDADACAPGCKCQRAVECLDQEGELPAQFGDLAAGVPLFDEPVGLTILSTDAIPTNILVDALFPSAR